MVYNSQTYAAVIFCKLKVNFMLPRALFLFSLLIHVLYSKCFVIVCRWNLETKGCSSVVAMLCAEFIALFMHSQRKPHGYGHNYKTDSLVVFIWG